MSATQRSQRPPKNEFYCVVSFFLSSRAEDDGRDRLDRRPAVRRRQLDVDLLARPVPLRQDEHDLLLARDDLARLQRARLEAAAPIVEDDLLLGLVVREREVEARDDDLVAAGGRALVSLHAS